MREKSINAYDKIYNIIERLKSELYTDGDGHAEVMREIDHIISDISVDVGHWDYVKKLDDTDTEKHRISTR